MSEPPHPDHQAVAALPNSVRARLDEIEREHSALVGKARSTLDPLAVGPVQLTLRVTKPLGFPPPEMSAQALGFAIRFDELPDDFELAVGQVRDRWHVSNLSEVRHVLNDFRPLIFNKSDSVYYAKVHNAWFPLLADKDTIAELTASDSTGADCTDALRRWVGATRRVLRETIDHFEFSYLYNGVLQHSDDSYSSRFFSDYSTGELNYVYWRHVSALRLIHHLLRPYRVLVGTVSFPNRGSLR